VVAAAFKKGATLWVLCTLIKVGEFPSRIGSSKIISDGIFDSNPNQIIVNE